MKIYLLLLLLIVQTLQAATIAVIDRGIDYNHPLLAHKMWSNPRMLSKGEFPKVLNGWNFAQKNNDIFDFSLLNSFPQDIHKLFHIYAKDFVMMDEDYLFMEKVNQDFMMSYAEFGEYAHGTHVAGIIVKDSNHQVMGLTFADDSSEKNLRFEINKRDYSSKDDLLSGLIAKFMKPQTDILASMTRFMSIYPSDIVNVSMGITLNEIRPMTDRNYKAVYEKSPQKHESDKAASIALNMLQLAYDNLMSVQGNTLFVFAAGNSHSDNDMFLYSPSNTSASNAISVAATQGRSALAAFSNFGLKTVDVAEPGVDIYSPAPGVDEMPMSGTSMAAPYVSRIAGMIKDLNIKLTPLEIKRILMETVDKRPFLTNKVKSGGIVNEARSLRAAELSIKLDLNRAILEAKAEIPQ